MTSYTPRPRTPEWERDTAALVAAAELARHDEECGCLAADQLEHNQAEDAFVSAGAARLSGTYYPVRLYRDGTLITRFRSIA
jgi:hypothetical protein